MVKIEIKNIDEFKSFMKEKQDAIKNTIPKSVFKATEFMFNKVKDSIARGTNAPVAVDTGRFLNSVDFEAVGPNEAKVFTDLEYAKFIEFGTFKMNARPHFRNTAFTEKEKVREEMNADIKAAIK
jgi:HK97 gp10 family phage protein